MDDSEQIALVVSGDEGKRYGSERKTSFLESKEIDERSSSSTASSVENSLDASHRRQLSEGETSTERSRSHQVSSSINADVESYVSINRFSPKTSNGKPKKQRRNRSSSSVFSAAWRKTSVFSTSVRHWGTVSNAHALQVSLLHTKSLIDIPSDDRKASTFVSAFNGMSMMTGLSALAMPFVTARAGIAGVALNAFLGALSCYTALLILKCQYQVSRSRPGVNKRIHATFIEIGITAFPKFGPMLMKAITLSSMLTDVYMFILLGRMSVDLLHASVPLDNGTWIILWALLVLPWLFVKRMSILAWTGLISLFTLLCGFAVIYGYLFSLHNQWNWDVLMTGVSPKYFSIAYGILLNCYNLHLTVPALEGSMRHPESCAKVIVIAFAGSTMIKVSLGIFGAIAFGSLTGQTITTDLTASNTTIAIFVSIATALNIYFFFPVSLFVVLQMLDVYFLPSFSVFKGSRLREVGWQVVSRLFILSLVVFIAVSVPQFGLIISVVGNIRGTLLAVVLPIAFYLNICWRRLHIAVKIVNIIIMIVCCLLGSAGAYFAMQGLAFGL